MAEMAKSDRLALDPDRPGPLLRAQEVAALLAVSIRTVRRLARSGKLASVAIGSSLRFRPEDVENLIAQNLRETPTQGAPLRRGGQRLMVPLNWSLLRN